MSAPTTEVVKPTAEEIAFARKEVERWVETIRYEVDEWINVRLIYGDKTKKEEFRTKNLHYKSFDLTSHVEELLEWNRRGYGIYGMVNPTTATGTRAKHVTKARAVFIDSDGNKGRAALLELADMHHIPPVMVIRTSAPNRLQLYWPFETPIQADQFNDWKRLLDRLVDTFDADENAKGLSRVMRIPGFRHTKILKDDPDAAYEDMLRCEIIGTPSEDRYGLPDFKGLLHNGSVPDPRGQSDKERMAALTKEADKLSGLDKFNEDDLDRKYPAPTLAQVETCLGHLIQKDVDDREVWIEVGQCIHSVDSSDAGLAVWEPWSQKSDKYKDGECAEKWAGFTKGGGLTFASLVRRALQRGMPYAELRPKQEQGWVPFPLDTLPRDVQWIAKEISSGMCCDLIAVVFPILACVAGIVGVSHKLKLYGNWLEPCILWFMLIARSSMLKSPPHRWVMGPLLDWQALQRQHRDELEAGHIEDVEVWKAEMAQWRKKKAGTRGEMPIEPPELPPAPRVTIKDATLQAHYTVLANEPFGLLKYMDELDGWFNSMNQFGNKGQDPDTPRWLENYNGVPDEIDRKGPTGKGVYVAVPAAATSVYGTIQPKVARRNLQGKNAENGMLFRFLFAQPPKVLKRWNPPKDADTVLERWTEIVQAIIKLRRTTKETIELRLSPEAERLFETWVNKTGEQAFHAPDDEGSLHLKIEAVAARLAIVLHVLHEACETGIEDGTIPLEVGEQTAADAIRLARWFKNESLRMLASVTRYEGGDEEDEDDADRLTALLQWMEGRDAKDGFTARDLTRGLRAYRGEGGAERAEADLERLAKKDHGTWGYGTNGRVMKFRPAATGGEAS